MGYPNAGGEQLQWEICKDCHQRHMADYIFEGNSSPTPTRKHSEPPLTDHRPNSWAKLRPVAALEPTLRATGMRLESRGPAGCSRLLCCASSLGRRSGAGAAFLGLMCSCKAKVALRWPSLSTANNAGPAPPSSESSVQRVMVTRHTTLTRPTTQSRTGSKHERTRWLRTWRSKHTTHQVTVSGTNHKWRVT